MPLAIESVEKYGTDMDQWIEIRRRVLNGELRKRDACVEYGIHFCRPPSTTNPDVIRSSGNLRMTLEPFLHGPIDAWFVDPAVVSQLPVDGRGDLDSARWLL